MSDLSCAGELAGICSGGPAHHPRCPDVDAIVVEPSAAPGAAPPAARAADESYTITGIIVLDPLVALAALMAKSLSAVIERCGICDPASEYLCDEHRAMLADVIPECGEPGCWTCAP